MKTVNLLNLNIKIDSKDELIAGLKKSFNQDNKIFISKINSEFVKRAYENPTFCDTLNKSDFYVIDGVGPCWLARYLTLPISSTPVLRQLQAVWQMVYSGASLVLYPKYCTYPIKDRLAGIDAFKLMLKTAEEENAGVYIFGGRGVVLTDALKKINEEFPKLNISSSNGYDKKEEAVDLINKTEAKLLFVGLGSPEQEEWICKNLNKLKNIRVAVGEGGTIDRIANPLVKAPKLISVLGVEWLWRLFANKNLTTGAGSRFARVWNSVPVLIVDAVKYKIKNGQVEVVNEEI